VFTAFTPQHFYHILHVLAFCKHLEQDIAAVITFNFGASMNQVYVSGFYRTIVLGILLCCCMPAIGQTWELKGRVYDISQITPVESVTVLTTSGRGTMTDTLGRYSILVHQGDSVYFSYQNRVTGRYPVAKMEDQTQFNMSLHVHVYNVLPNVTVRGNTYKTDSLINRREYAKYFNFNKPNPLNSINVGPTGVGMDPNEIINMFRFKRNRQIKELQERLMRDEQEKYVDHRFNRAFIKKLTRLDGEELKNFAAKYKPPYDFLVLTNELELGYYIQQCYKKEKGELPTGVVIYQMGIQAID
jgi:hypothetical protein